MVLSMDLPLGGLPLVFGGAPIGGLYQPVSDEAASQALAAAWDAGIRAFDTAPHYGAGLSERRIGDFLAGRRRDEFIVCTKVGRLLVPARGDVDGAEGFYGTPPLTRVRDYSRDGVLRSLEDSLVRLGLDRVDIALIHDPDDFMGPALDEAYPALAELRSQGVVTAIGAGMNSAAPLAWLVERSDVDCVLVAGRYTLLDDSAAARLFPLCLRCGVAVLAGGVFNSGILADAADGADGGRYDYAQAPPAVLARARRLRDACARYGVPLAAAALQFTLRHSAVSAAVVGARAPEEIVTDVTHLSLTIPEALWAEVAPSNLACAFDGDGGGVGSGGGDGLADFQAEPSQPVVGQEALGDSLGRGFDEPELAFPDHGGDRGRHRGVVQGVREVVARGGRSHVSGCGDHVHVEDQSLLDGALPLVHADHRPDGQVPDRNSVRPAHGTEASHCSTPAMCTVDQELDQGFGGRIRPDAVEQRAQAFALRRGDPLRRRRGGGGFQDAPHPEELKQRVVTVEVDDKAQCLEQQPWLQAGHVGAVAAPHVEDVDQGQCPHRLAQRAARQPEVRGEVRLTRQPVARAQRTGRNHGLDLLDGLVGHRHGTPPTSPSP
jgi:D-threo-aldose 1-dehydrogenase